MAQPLDLVRSTFVTIIKLNKVYDKSLRGQEHQVTPGYIIRLSAGSHHRL